jgi:hypothetical protein
MAPLSSTDQGGGNWSGQITRLSPQPLADDASARLSTTAALTKFLFQRRFMGTLSEAK